MLLDTYLNIWKFSILLILPFILSKYGPISVVDATMDGCLTLDKSIIVGGVQHCTSFANNKCLCDLRNECRFDESTSTCSARYDCSKHSSVAAECRANHCEFECSTGECIEEERESCVGSTDKCSAYCHNRCSCAYNGCNYNTNGACSRRSEEACQINMYHKQTCRRASAFYYINGKFCKAERSTGACLIEKTVKGLNLGGTTIIDEDGVLFEEENSTSFVDPFSIRRVAHVKLENEDSIVKAIFQSVVYGDPTRRESGRCLTYYVNLCENGMYELIIKTIEMSKVNAGEKLFNVRMAGQDILAEIDLIEIVGKAMLPATFVIQFDVHQNILTIEGHSPVFLKNSSVPIDFCYSECVFAEGSFQVSAFAVNKFLGQYRTDSICEKYSGYYWDCRTLGCTYDQLSHECKKSPQNCTDVCKNECENPRLEVVFLLDSTGPSKKRPQAGSDLVYENIERIVNIMEPLSMVFPNSKFGVSLFSDFSCIDRNECERNDVEHHDVPEGCYQFHQTLTDQLDVVKRVTQKNYLPYFPHVFTEPGIFGLMMLSQDVQMNWTRSNAKDVFKIMLLITEDGNYVYNFVGGGKKFPPKFDGTDRCSSTLQPTKESLSSFFIEEGFSVVILVKSRREENFSDGGGGYREWLEALKIPFKFGRIEDDAFKIFKDISELVLTNFFPPDSKCRDQKLQKRRA